MGLYVKNYEIKINQNKHFKKVLFIICITILSLAFLGIIALICFDIIVGKNQLNDISIIISSLVSFLVLVIGLLKIITTYVFPQKDEENIANLVQLVQKNDLQMFMIRQNIKEENDIKKEAAK